MKNIKAKIYHNPRCSKSRQTLELLKKHTSDIEIIEYLKDPIKKTDLSEIIKKIGIRAEELVRKKENIFKENFKNKDMTQKDYLDAMIQFPVLMERPIVVSNNKAILGRPPENVNKLF